jgi:hypothetical protein
MEAEAVALGILLGYGTLLVYGLLAPLVFWNPNARDIPWPQRVLVFMLLPFALAAGALLNLWDWCSRPWRRK